MKKIRFMAIALLSHFLIIHIAASSAIAGPPGHGQKPLRGFGEIQAVLTAGLINCLAPDGTIVAQLPRQFDALARYTLMGRTTGTIVAEGCDFNPADGTLMLTGPVTQTAANGDELHAEFLAVFAPDFSFDLEVWIYLGTGRFTNACGSAAGGGELDPGTGYGLTWLSGWLSVPRGNGGGAGCD